MASINKPVYFNIETEKELLIYADSIGKRQFSQWVKDKLRAEMTSKGLQEVKNTNEIQDVEIKKELTTPGRSQSVEKKSLVWSCKL